jgi:hypothetical protein
MLVVQLCHLMAQHGHEALVDGLPSTTLPRRRPSSLIEHLAYVHEQESSPAGLNTSTILLHSYRQQFRDEATFRRVVDYLYHYCNQRYASKTRHFTSYQIHAVLYCGISFTQTRRE